MLLIVNATLISCKTCSFNKSQGNLISINTLLIKKKISSGDSTGKEGGGMAVGAGSIRAPLSLFSAEVQPGFNFTVCHIWEEIFIALCK